MKNPIDKLKEMEKRLAFNENKETISLENVEKKIQNNSALIEENSSKIQENSAKIQENLDKITALDERLTANEKYASDVYWDVVEANRFADSLSFRIGTIEKNVPSYDEVVEKIPTIEDKVSSNLQRANDAYALAYFNEQRITEMEYDVMSLNQITNGYDNLFTELRENISTLQNSIEENSNSISHLKSQANGNYSLIEKNTTQITENQTNILEHSVKINEMREELDSQTFINNQAIISAFNTDFDEPILWEQKNSDAPINFKRIVDAKHSNGPRGRILARVKPGTFFRAKLKVYFDVLKDETGEDAIFFLYPLGKITINGVGEEERFTLNNNSEDLTQPILEREISFVAKEAFIEIKFELNDALYANIALDYLELEVCEATNFLCLTKDCKHFARCVYYTTATRNVNEFAYTVHEKDNFYYYHGATFTLANAYTKYYPNEKYDDIGHIRQFAMFINTYSNRPNFWICGDNDDLYRSYEYNMINRTWLMDNVFDMEYSEYSQITVHHSAEYLITDNNYKLWCGTYPINAGMQADIESMKFNKTEELISEFVGVFAATGINMGDVPYSESLGYLLQHKSGHVLYIPSEEPDYFIDFGIGSNPFLMSTNDYLTLHIFYRRGNNLIEQVMTRDSIETKEWKISPIKKIYLDRLRFYSGNYDFYLYEDINNNIIIADMPQTETQTT